MVDGPLEHLHQLSLISESGATSRDCLEAVFNAAQLLLKLSADEAGDPTSDLILEGTVVPNTSVKAMSRGLPD